MNTFVSTFRKLPAILLGSCLLASFCSPPRFAAAAAVTQDEPTGRSFWQLHPGNQFLVKGTVSRTTRISRADQPDTTAQTRDHFDLLYVVEDMDPAGRLTMSVRVIRSLREPDDADREGMAIAERRLGLLEDIRLTMIVNRDGSIDTIAPGDPEAFAAALGGLHPASNGFLNTACTPDVITGWISRPFLLVVDPQLIQKDYQWTRPEVISLGLLGSIRTHVDARIQEPLQLPNGEAAPDSPQPKDSGLLNVQLSQNGPHRYLPARLPSNLAASLPLKIKDATAEVAELSGSATLFNGSQDAQLGSPGPRPQFNALSITIGIQGSCTVETGGTQQELKFQQTQQQEWTLSSWRTGQPRMVTPDGVPVPIPQPNP